MKYGFILFCIVNLLQASENQLSALDRIVLYNELKALRNHIIREDRVIQHELSIHAVIFNSLLNSNDQSIENMVATNKEIDRFLRVIRLRSQKNSRYKELIRMLKITPSMQDALPILSDNNQIPSILLGSGTRRSRSQDSNATILVTQSSNISYISSSRVVSRINSRSSSLSHDSIESEDTIPYTENN